MKLKSLKLALKVLDVCLRKHKELIANEEDKEYDKGIEAYKDINGCIKIVEKQIEDLKKADILDAMGTCLCFDIMVDFPNRGYLKKDDPLNPYLRAEKIEKEQKQSMLEG